MQHPRQHHLWWVWSPVKPKKQSFGIDLLGVFQGKRASADPPRRRIQGVAEFVSRTADRGAIEDVLTGGNGQIQGIGVSGWDSELKQRQQLWADKDRIVTVYVRGPAGGRYTYRNIQPNGIDAEYGSRGGEDGPWITVWSCHLDRIRLAEK
jgi:hypothetical protein